jgi:hypothetical protein
VNEDPPGSQPGDIEPVDLEPIPVPDAPPGWYPDPWSPGQQRLWDGTAWTAQTHGAVPVVSPWPATPSDPPLSYAGRARRGRAGAIVAGLIALSLVSGAVGYAIEAGTDSNDAASGTRAPTTIAPGPPAEAPAIGDRTALVDLVVKNTDIEPPRVVVLKPDGNRTSDPTLDLCNGRFATEKQRVARLQVDEIVPNDTSNGSVALSTEAVTYKRAADGTKAFAELRSVRRACPRGPVTSPVGGDTVAYKFNAAPDRTWKHTPTVERLAYSFVVTAAEGTIPSVTVYLRRGRALMALYFPEPSGPQPAVGGKTSIEAIVGLFEARMARLPAKVGGNGT